MALINCVECRKEISDKAVSCPNCGCPVVQKIDMSEGKSELYTLKLIDTIEKVKAIKVIRIIFGNSLKDAKEIADKAPVVIASGLTKDEVTEMAQLFCNNFIKVEIYDDSNITVNLNLKPQPPQNKYYSSEPFSNNSSTQINLPSCPKCGSTDFEMIRRNWSLFAGFMTNKVDRVCRNCKCKF